MNRPTGPVYINYLSVYEYIFKYSLEKTCHSLLFALFLS